MRWRRHQPVLDEDEGIDVAPLLDVVFIMLIFFVVTTSFVKESGIEVNRPTAETASTRDRAANVIVALRADGAIWIDGREVDLRAVRPNVERLRAENPEAAVIVDADRDASAGRLVEIMDQVRLAGVESVSIAADHGPP